MANAWWACYGSDYLSKTGHLTMLQHGAYFTLLNTYYVTGEPLPVSNEQLVRMCRAHSAEEIEAISFILSAFFILKSDGWHNKRADEEIRRQAQVSKQYRLRAKKAACNRWSRRDATSIPQALLGATESQSQSHIEQIQKQKGASRPTFTVPDWIPMENWQGYVKMRQLIGKPMTERAKQFAVKCLEKLLSDGDSPAAVLDQSTFNSWQGLFPLRSNANGANGRNHKDLPRAAERYHSNNAMFERELGLAAQTQADGRGHEAVDSPRTINALGTGAK